MRLKAIISSLILVSLIVSLFAGVVRIQADACRSAVVSSNLDPSAANSTTPANCNTQNNVYGMQMRALLAEMVAHPRPDLQNVPIDESMLYSKGYRKVLKETDIYDAPGGNVVGHIEAGFNFVNAGRESGNFMQISPNRWLPKDALGPANKSVSRFSGVLLPDGLPERPFGWMVVDTKPSKMPGAKPAPETQTVPRYTLLSFFATEIVDGWEWYLIGPDQWVVQTRVARVKPATRPAEVSGKWFAVDLYEQTLIAYDNDKPVLATLIASGLPKWPTNEGVFKIWDRYAQAKMSGASGLPDAYFLPQVPWIMYFNQDEQALHGAYWHDRFGYRASHGCVNMSLTDAQWAFEWTKDSPSAYVYVYHSDEYRSGAPR
jgi:hypothetical protein